MAALLESNATLDADGEICGPIIVTQGKNGSYAVDITGTITVTLQRRFGGGAFINVETGYTSDTTKDILGPGEYQLIASGTAGGSAICNMLAHTRS